MASLNHVEAKRAHTQRHCSLWLSADIVLNIIPLFTFISLLEYVLHIKACT